MQEVMQQHSRWLQGFREQVALVAALQPAVATRLQCAARQEGAAGAHANSLAAGLAAALSRPPVTAAASRLPEAAPGAGLCDGGEALADQSTGLSPVASSSLLPAPSSCLAMGQPLTVDIGGDQELVISVVHKAQ
jgi:hypothetical protein